MNRSDPEQRLLNQIIGSDLPAPHTEYRFAPPRTWRFDFAFPIQRIAVEVEGGTMTRPRKVGNRWYQLVSGHTSGVGYQSNCDKYNEAALLGWTVLRVTSADVENGRALSLIHRAFAARKLGGSV